MKKIFGILAAVMMGVAMLGSAAPTEVEAASNKTATKTVTTASCEKNFLGFRPWYKGLTEVVNGKCEIKTPPSGDWLAGYVATIILNVLADLFVLVGYLVSAMIIIGGYQYITATGDPGKLAKAKKRIVSAVIGLAIVIFANVIINLIVGALTNSAS